jgi:hypothetical protein
MALTKGQYRDPLEILIRKEEKSCKGCAHVTEVLGKDYCAKKDKAAVKRCRDYKDKE